MKDAVRYTRIATRASRFPDSTVPDNKCLAFNLKISTSPSPLGDTYPIGQLSTDSALD